MKLDQFFSLRRFLLLIKKDVLLYARPILIAAGALLCLQLFNGITSYYFVKKYDLHLYPVVLLLGGLILTGVAFAELHNPRKSYSFLTLPASTFEKFLARLILTSIGYVLTTLVMFCLSAWIGNQLNLLFYQEKYPNFVPFSKENLLFIQFYLTAQAVFLWAAIFFKRYPLLKMSLIVMGFIVIMDVAVEVSINTSVGMLFQILFLPFGKVQNGMELNVLEKTITGLFDTLGMQVPFMRIRLFNFIAPVFWLLAFYTLTKSER